MKSSRGKVKSVHSSMIEVYVLAETVFFRNADASGQEDNKVRNYIQNTHRRARLAWLLLIVQPA